MSGAAASMRSAPTDALTDRIAAALHPLERPPTDPGWNRDELVDLLDADAERAEAAVLVALMARDDGPTVLFTRRHENLSRHAGQISFPGGRVDPDDVGPVDAALREAHEEVGLPRGHATPLGFLDPYETISAFRVVPVVARVAPDFELRLDPREVDSAFEVPLSFLLAPDSAQRVQAVFRGLRRHYWEFHYDGHRIWGATAAMLVNLRERLAAVGGTSP